MVKRKLSRDNHLKYKYGFLKYEDGTIIGVDETNTYTKRKQNWKLDKLISIKEFNTHHELTESFFRTQRWLKEKHLEYFI